MISRNLAERMWPESATTAAVGECANPQFHRSNPLRTTLSNKHYLDWNPLRSIVPEYDSTPSRCECSGFGPGAGYTSWPSRHARVLLRFRQLGSLHHWGYFWGCPLRFDLEIQIFKKKNINFAPIFNVRLASDMSVFVSFACRSWQASAECRKRARLVL